MKKRTQRIISLLAACAMTMGTVGIVSAEEVSWTNDDAAEITIFMGGDNTPNEDNLVLQELEKQTNTNINMLYVPGADKSTKLNAMIAAGDLPDIFQASIQDIEDLKAAGLLADMTDVLNAVGGNVLEETKDVLQEVSVNQDGIYMIPNTNLGYATNVCIRTDWLENLGLEMPTDLESFAAVMHAFTYDDPDGDGVDNTYGYAMCFDSLASDGGPVGANLFGAFGIPKGKNILLEDGTVTTWVKHPKFLDAIKYIKGLIDDGVCEPDYMTIPQMSMFEKLWTGTAGCLEWNAVGPTNNWMPGRYTEDPTPTFGFATLEGPDGESGVPASYPNQTSGWVFSSSCENLEGAARIANYLMTEEGSDLLYLGVEGVMYNWVDKENGTTERIGEYADDATHRAAGGYSYIELFRPKSDAELRTLNAQTQEGVALAWENKIDWVNVTTASEVWTECGADMNQLTNEMIAELLTTDAEDMQAVYDDYMEEWSEIGGADWEVEMTELWNAQNQ